MRALAPQQVLAGLVMRATEESRVEQGSLRTTEVEPEKRGEAAPQAGVPIRSSSIHPTTATQTLSTDPGTNQPVWPGLVP